MKEIQWKSITLAGFGPYKDKITIDLEKGLNLLVAPNESGKSTLAEGLRAVIFGLPNLRDPKIFGIARFRSWFGAENFFGEVVFLANGVCFRVRREFESHKVSIWKETKEGWLLELETEHNPAATRGSGIYQNYLENLLGITNDALFMDIFYLTQPLPEIGNLSEELRVLLSGSGGNFTFALKELENELGKLTRFLRERGFSANKIKDRELEKLNKEITELETEISLSSQQANELQKTLKELAGLTVDLNDCREKKKQKSQFLSAWTQSRQLQKDYQKILEEQSRLKETLTVLGDLDRELKSLEKKKKDDFSLFLDLPDDFGEIIQLQHNSKNELSAAENDLHNLGIKLEAQKKAIQNIKDELDDLQQFRVNPSLLIDKRTLERFRKELAEKAENGIDLIKELATLRLEEESEKRRKGILKKRLVYMSFTSIFTLGFGWILDGFLGALAGFFLGVCLGWVISVYKLGNRKQALEIPKTKELMTEIGRLDPNLKEVCLSANPEELEQLVFQLNSFLKNKLKIDSFQASLGFSQASVNSTSYQEEIPFIVDLKKQVEALEEKISPYTIDSSFEIVQRDFEKYQKLNQEIERVKGVFDEIKKQYEEAENKVLKLKAECEKTENEYELLREKNSLLLEALKKKWQEFLDLKRKSRELGIEFQTLLKSVQVKDQKELKLNYLDVQNKGIRVQKELDELATNHPGVPSFDDEQGSSRLDLEREYSELKQEIADLEVKEEALLENQQRLKLKQGELEGKGLINIAQGEIKLKELKKRKKELQFEIDALEIAYKELNEAAINYNSTYRERLAERITEYFKDFTDRERKVIITEDFEMKVIEEGKERDPNQFSQGARDQLFFALRLGIADLLMENFHLPFILDDPFINYDQSRLQEVEKLLTLLSEKRQFLLLTHREDLASWGNQVEIKGAG